jgi:hypothetical protein
VQRPGLADQRHDRRLGVEECPQARVVLDLAARQSRRAERGQRRVLEIDLLGPLEELGVLRVGSGPAALDDVDAEPVQRGRDPQLVGDRQVKPDLLRAVPQSRVVDLHLRCRHGHHVPPGRPS